RRCIAAAEAGRSVPGADRQGARGGAGDPQGSRRRVRSETSMATATLTANKASLLSSTTVIARRTFVKFLRTPALVVVGTVQGAMFLLIFRYVFGGAISAGGGVSYVNFLVPGFITTGIIWQGMMSAGGIADDLDQGFFD